MDPYERHKDTTNDMMGDARYLNVEKRKGHAFQWEMLW